MTAPLPSPAEQAVIDRFDAGEPAEESFGERLSDALAAELESLGLAGEMSARASLYLADAAIAVMRGEQQ